MGFKRFVEQSEADSKNLVIVVADNNNFDPILTGVLKKYCSSSNVNLIICGAEDTTISKTKLKFEKTEYSINPNNTIINLRTSKNIEEFQKAEKMGYFVFNNPKVLELTTSKWDTQKFLEDNNFTAPKSFLVKTEDEVKKATDSIKSYPMILKILDGYGGNGVQKFEDYDSILAGCQALWAVSENEKDTPLIIQEFLESDYDVRVTMIDGEVSCAAKRQSEHFRNNLSQDGKKSDFALAQEDVELCKQVTEKLGAAWLGIDLMYHNEKSYIIELNSATAIRIDKEKITTDITAFFDKKFSELK